MGRKKVDRLGQRFGRLLVVEEHNERIRGNVAWKCLCDCGNYTVATNGHLQSGETQSCGCLQRQRGLENHTTHGMTGTREHRIWLGMKSRCNNPNRPKYKNYGAKGIKVCERWDEYANFYSDMGPCPEGFSIERLDNAKGYSPDNCIWADRYTQAWNRRNSGANPDTKFRGVRLSNGKADKFHSRITVAGEEKYLGSFTSLEQAIQARIEAEVDVKSQLLGEISK